MKPLLSNAINWLIRNNKVNKELAKFQKEVDQIFESKKNDKPFSEYPDDYEEIPIPELLAPAWRKIPPKSLRQTEIIRIAFLSEMKEFNRKMAEKMMQGKIFLPKVHQAIQMVRLEYYKARVHQYLEAYQFTTFRIDKCKQRITEIEQLPPLNIDIDPELQNVIAKQKNLLSRKKVWEVFSLIGKERIHADGELLMIHNRLRDLESHKIEGTLSEDILIESTDILGLYLVDKIDEWYEQQIHGQNI